MNIFNILAISFGIIVSLPVLYLLIIVIGELFFVKRALFLIKNDVEDFNKWFSDYIIFNKYKLNEYNNIILNINEFMLFKEQMVFKIESKYKNNFILKYFTKHYLLDKQNKDLGVNTMNYITRCFLMKDIFLDVNKKVNF
jgi:hypothetical protein